MISNAYDGLLNDMRFSATEYHWYHIYEDHCIIAAIFVVWYHSDFWFYFCVHCICPPPPQCAELKLWEQFKLQMVIRTKVLSASWVSHPSVVLTKLPPFCYLWLDRSIIITLACFRLVRNHLTLEAECYRSHQFGGRGVFAYVAYR